MTALFLGVLGYIPLWGQNIDFTPDKPDGPANIQSALWELAMPGAGKRVGGLQDTVVVILVPQLGQASASIDTSSLAAFGGRVLAQSKSLMRVAVPASSLLAVSEMPGVRFVRRPYRPQAQQETFSEGGWSIKAYDNYYAGVRGQGVKVAIIDGGFKGAHPDDLPGDMPGFRYYDHTGEGIYAGESVHGTACAEIIHDMAPEAELYLYKVGDLVDLENAKDRCIENGIDIINHSMTWYGTGIGDGEGIACNFVNHAADNGILWVNAASNSAKSHYFQSWSDRDSNGWHNFNGGDETIGFQAEKGTEISIYLTWNDWPNTRDNYDLYLYSSNSSGKPNRDVARSIDVQSGSHKPVEWIEYTVEKSGQYHIAVSKSPDARSRRLKIWSFNRNLDFEYSSSEGSIGIPADAEGAMSVGAIYYDHYSLGRIADYSSRGPTFDGRIKPELVAPTGVSTVSYGSIDDSDGYHGTSAAAPHVAGAAALIKSANPSYSRTQLWDALIAATVDVGTRGQDNTFGHGKLVLPVLPQELPSAGPFGYSPPVVYRNLRSVKFGFGWSNRDLYCYFSAKEISRGEVDIFLNDQKYGSIPANWDWKRWYLRLDRTDLRSGQNTIEFRNLSNQNRTSSFARWQLKDVDVTSRRPANAKPIAGPQLLSELPDGLVSGLGDPFPTPFNAEVTIPFTIAAAAPVRLTVYNLMGQSIRVLADGWTEAGLHQVRWDGRTDTGAEAASGVYWAVLQAGGVVQTAKLALIR